MLPAPAAAPSAVGSTRPRHSRRLRGADAAFWLDSGRGRASATSASAHRSMAVGGPVLDGSASDGRAAAPRPTDARPASASAWSAGSATSCAARRWGVAVSRTVALSGCRVAVRRPCARVRPRDRRGRAARSRDGVDGELAALARRVAALAGALAPRGASRRRPRRRVTWPYTDDEYLDMIAACQAAIHEGDAYQLCLTTEAAVDASSTPSRGTSPCGRRAPPTTAALLRIGGVALLSASPEQFPRR